MDCSISDYLATPNRMNKIFIPGRFPGDAPQLVNRKQARRILIMRQKKTKQWQKLLNQGINVNPQNESGKLGVPRPKRQDRVKVANNRKREKGLFVNKYREHQLNKGLSETEETLLPD